MTTALRLPRVVLAGVFAAITFAFLGFSLMLGSTAAHAHDELVGYTAEQNATGTVELTFSFNNTIMDVGAQVIAMHDNGTDLADGAPVISGRDVIQRLVADLPEGQASVAWRVVSSDGHPISEVFTLNIAADGAVQLKQGAPENNAVDPDTDTPDNATPDDSASGDNGQKNGAQDDATGTDQAGIQPISGVESTGIPVGGLIGIGAAVVAIILVVVLLARRGKKSGAANTDAADTEEPGSES